MSLTFSHEVSRHIANGGFAQKVSVPATTTTVANSTAYSNQLASYNSTLHGANVPLVFGTLAYTVFVPSSAILNGFYTNIATAFDSSAAVSVGSGLAVAAAADPTIANVGTAASTTYTYRVARVSGGGLAPSAAVSTTTGNATLSATNYNTVTEGTAVVGVQYNVYRSVGGATQGLIGTVVATSTSFVFSDTGLAATGTTPTTNTTGLDLVSGVTLASGTGAFTISLKPTVSQSLVSDGQTLFVSVSGTPTIGSAYLTAIYLNPPVFFSGNGSND